MGAAALRPERNAGHAAPLVEGMVAGQRKIGLDIVRAAAILFVVACHFVFYYAPNPSVAVPLGAVGVEIFFVLSGYLIGGIFLNAIARDDGQVTLRTLGVFWTRRWLRTIPNYVLFLGIYSWLSQTHQHLLPYLTFTQNFAWRRPGFFEVSWSLAVEEWFYILLPVLVFATSRLLGSVYRSFLVTIAILLVCPTVLRLLFGAGKWWNSDVRMVVIYRFDAAMYGVLLAMLERFHPTVFRRLKSPLAFAAGALLLAPIMVYLGLRHADGALDFIATRADMLLINGIGIGCGLVLPFCSGIGRVPPLVHAAAYHTSLWSYSMYLCHVPVMWATRAVSARAWPERPAALEALMALCFIFVLSRLVYRCVELPILDLRDWWTRPEKVTPAVPLPPNPPPSVETVPSSVLADAHVLMKNSG